MPNELKFMKHLLVVLSETGGGFPRQQDRTWRGDVATIKNPVFSTDQIAISKFRKHGRVEYDPHGRLLLTSATGPFNAELIAALRELAIITFPNMALLGSWAQCVVFHESAMGGADV